MMGMASWLMLVPSSRSTLSWGIALPRAAMPAEVTPEQPLRESSWREGGEVGCVNGAREVKFVAKALGMRAESDEC